MSKPPYSTQSFATADHTTYARLSIWVSLIGLLALLIWAALAKIDQVTHAKATVIASGLRQQVQAPDGGIIQTMAVKEGQTVKRGQPLAVLQQTQARAALDDSQAKVAALQAKLTRLDAELYQRPLHFSATLDNYPQYVSDQTRLYQRRKQAYTNSVSALQHMRALSQKQLDMTQPLLAYGDVSATDVLKLQQQVANIEAQITNKRDQFLQQAQTERAQTQAQLDLEQAQRRTRAQTLQQTRLIAPSAGVVNDIKVTTLGGVVKPGQTLIELTPTDSDLIAQAQISPKDIADVKVGQSASVKLDAYDYAIFGAIKGRVSYISPDTLMQQTNQGERPYYRVRLTLSAPYVTDPSGKPLPIKPGMTGSVDIKAKDRTVLSYLTKPITKTLDRGLTER